MPLIVVHGLSKNVLGNEGEIAEIEKAILGAISNVPELDLEPSDVSFSFLQDPTITFEAVTIMIIVELLFEKPKRTIEVRQRLARKIAEAFRHSGFEGRKVEVAVKRFNPDKDGFFSAG